MKCPHQKAAVVFRADNSGGGSKVSQLQACPAPSPIKPHFPPVEATTVLPVDTSSTVHDKENSTRLDDGFEDSGYLSLQNSQIDDHHGDAEDEQRGKNVKTILQAAVATKGKTKPPKNSPSKCQVSANCSQHGLLSESPVSCYRRRPALFSLSSTPSDHLKTPLPILEFQKAVCEELAKSYRKNKT